MRDKKTYLDFDISIGGRNAIRELNTLGHIPLIVGGAVRDSILDIPCKDIDIEVYHVSYDRLEEILSRHGTINIVGKAFGIIKFKCFNGMEYDFSVPRTENKIGVGHKGFEVSVDPFLTPEKAAKRRDFTINTLAYDLIGEELYDFYGGKADLSNGVIKHTSEQFSEDPLRVLRALQFQCRFGFDIHEDTWSLMEEMVTLGTLKDLPKERICEEWTKWAVKGRHHHRVFEFLRRTGMELGDLTKMIDTEQEAEWHPEGNVEVHTIHVMEEALRIADREDLQGDDRAVLIFSALLHDIAKPATTKVIDGRITSRNHEPMGEPMAHDILTQMGIKQSIKDKVGCLIANHLKHVSIFNEKINPSKATKTLARKLFKKGTSIAELLLLIEADASGRPPLPKGLPESGKHLKKLAETIEVITEPTPDIVMGRHLIEWGIKPSPEFGVILKAARDAQDSGMFNDLVGGMTFVSTMTNIKPHRFSHDDDAKMGISQ